MSFLYTSIHFFYNYPLFLCALIFTVHATDDCDKVRTSGTGTVLFNPTDVYKTCWSQEEVAILTARIILEDVIPDPKMISIQCNDDIEDLVQYFKVVIETIRSNTKARKKHIMLLALIDLLGGFLHHAILPMSRKAYYAGVVDYAYMEKIIQLYEELKWFLRTNGQGWTKPMIITKEVKVPIIEFGSNSVQKDNESCCQNLLFYEYEPVKTRKRSANVEKGVYFPLPFFDAKVKPTAVALPLKHFALRNVESKRAAYVLMKYFITAEQCLKEKHAKPEMINKFQNNLYTWIEKDVIPKLNDDKFYSAFGGIFRVQNTLRALGATYGNRQCNTDIGEEEVGAIPGVGCSSRRNKLLLIAMLVIIVAWFLIGTCFICYRMKNNRITTKKSQLDDTKPSSGSASSSSFSSSRWSSMLSKSSSKTDKQLCKCCESSISEKSTVGLSSTSEYDSEKTKKNRRNNKPFRSSAKKTSQSSPCICPNSDDPAVIDTKHSMKVLPSIAEISEHSISKEKNGSFRKISFADESGISSSDGGIKMCAPPWAQTKNTIPCPKLSDKSTHFSSSRSTTTKSQAVQDSLLGAPRASSSMTDHHSLPQKSNQVNQSYNTTEYDQPLANSVMRQEPTSNDFDASNTLAENSSNKSINPEVNTVSTVEEHSFDDEEKSKANEEPQFNTDNSYYDYHMACHSSMSGNYDLYHKPDPTKPYIFGYDFQTTTSSEVSDDDDSKY